MRLKKTRMGAVGLLALVLAMGADSMQAGEGTTTQHKSEAELIAVLQSNAAAAEKAVTCKQLAIYGSSKAVPELARLLPDPVGSPGTELEFAL